MLDHLNISVKDLAESVDWYSRVFGFEVVEKGAFGSTPFAIIRHRDSMLCMYEHPSKKSPEDNGTFHKLAHFGWRIESEDKWMDTIERERVKIDHTWTYPHSKSWYLLDPTGHEIEVVVWSKNRVAFG